MTLRDDTPTAEASATDAVAQRLRDALVDDLDDGFAELVRTYQGVVYSVAFRTTGHRADAEDLAAESLLRAYRALRGYERDRLRSLNPRPWLLTIVVNTGRNQVRDAARRPRPSEGKVPERASSPWSVEEQVENSEMSAELARLLTRLPEVQRTAVVLRHVVDLPTDEVADVLGCPVGTAKSHVSRGLSRLRALIHEHEIHAEPGSAS